MANPTPVSGTNRASRSLTTSERASGLVESVISRVKEWLSEANRNDANFAEPTEFIESIPFTETRNYVQSVLRNAELYRRIYRERDSSPTLGSSKTAEPADP